MLAQPLQPAAASPPAPGPAGGLLTEFPFVLPRGYVDDSGQVHRDGVMRLATARDEILPQRDPRVRENEAYLTVILLSRVVTCPSCKHDFTIDLAGGGPGES